jgi:accessory gene regulator protein AgrB
MSLYSASSKIAKYITEEADLSSRQADRVRYGLKIILGTLMKGAVLLMSAGFLRILPQVIVALICGSCCAW